MEDRNALLQLAREMEDLPREGAGGDSEPEGVRFVRLPEARVLEIVKQLREVALD